MIKNDFENVRVHSEHNHEFHALNRRLNEEAKIKGEWSVKGHLLQSEAQSFEEEDQKVGPKSFVLGGTLQEGGVPLRDKMYSSAIKRLTLEEQEITDGCGSATAARGSDTGASKS